jgi:putative transcriptional regulator
MTRRELERLDQMSDEEVEAAARSDPDAQPLTEEELGSFRRVPDIKAIRRKLNLTQEQFAVTFQLSLATVRDWEQGRYQPDQAARTLLRVIEKEPGTVKRVLESA